MTYAYARVSAKDQNLERQLAAFCEFGIAQDCVFAEKESGKDFEREEYKRLLKRLKEGDLLVIQSIDRLGRSYGRIIEEWHRITKEIGADILVLDMPLLDTRVRSDSLVGRFIADVVLQVLSFVAENEREKIRARQAEGIRLAKERGVRFGRRPSCIPMNFCPSPTITSASASGCGPPCSGLRSSGITFTIISANSAPQGVEAGHGKMLRPRAARMPSAERRHVFPHGTGCPWV